MNVFRLAADLFHSLAIIILLLKLWRTRYCAGISGRSQILFALVYTTRYLDLFSNFISVYNSVMKIYFIGASYATLYLVYIKFKVTYDRNHDTFRIEFLLIPTIILAFVVNHEFSPLEVLWTFSIYLESVAILPQLFMISKTGKVDTLSHYLFCLGLYRALYILNWVHRYYSEGFYDLIAIVAGIVQTLPYYGLFYVYITRDKFRLFSLTPKTDGCKDVQLIQKPALPEENITDFGLKARYLVSVYENKLTIYEFDSKSINRSNALHSNHTVESSYHWHTFPFADLAFSPEVKIFKPDSPQPLDCIKKVSDSPIVPSVASNDIKSCFSEKSQLCFVDESQRAIPQNVGETPFGLLQAGQTVSDVKATKVEQFNISMENEKQTDIIPNPTWRGPEVLLLPELLLKEKEVEPMETKTEKQDSSNDKEETVKITLEKDGMPNALEKFRTYRN